MATMGKKRGEDFSQIWISEQPQEPYALSVPGLFSSCTCQGPASSVDVNNAALEAFISLRRGLKHSHLHAVKNSIRDFDVFRRNRLQLVKGANQIIQNYQVMAESQIVNQVALVGGKEEEKSLLLQSIS